MNEREVALLQNYVKSRYMELNDGNATKRHQKQM